MIVVLMCITVAVLLGWPVRFVGAAAPRQAPGRVDPAVATIPSGCVSHLPLDGGADFADDYHCAGIALNYHLDGAAHSPFPIWAGQWLFVDDQGAFRRGSCTFNRGIHPTIDSPAVPVNQALPNDPGGGRAAYLTWRYGNTSNDLTAAALWAVFHYYAQDAAGSNRATDPNSALVPSLDVVAAASGRTDVAATAVALDAEARRFSAGFTLDVELAENGHGEAHVMSGSTPVDRVAVTITVALVPGSPTSLEVTTDASGAAAFSVTGITADSGAETVSVTAVIDAPAQAQVYQGAPADRDASAQTLITSGGTTRLTATANAVVSPPRSTIPATTTTTSIPPTTTTTAPSTTTTTPTTTTEAETSTTSITLPPTTEPPTTPPTAQVEPPLPVTGAASDGVAYWATAMLVAGVGVVGAVRRRLAG